MELGKKKQQRGKKIDSRTNFRKSYTKILRRNFENRMKNLLYI